MLELKKTVPIEDLRKIPGGLYNLPIGTKIFPACSIYPEQEGWLILPPDSCNNEEAFNDWKDRLYSNTIDQGLEQINDTSISNNNK
jgi:hypothetical protein